MIAATNSDTLIPSPQAEQSANGASGQGYYDGGGGGLTCSSPLLEKEEDDAMDVDTG